MHSHFTKRNLVILLLVIIGVVVAFHVIQKYRGSDMISARKVLVCDRDSCLTDPNCQCYCSVKCGFREKDSSDKPVYIANDPNGKYCYCKQWDADNYTSRPGGSCADKEAQ